MTPLTALLAIARARLDRPTTDWIHSVLDGANDPLDTRGFRLEWTRVGRRTGSHAITPTLEEADWLRDAGLWPFVGWSLDECVRGALLLHALDVSEPDTHVALVQSFYNRGTIRERQAILRVLAFLPDPPRFAPLAEDACRSHVSSVFEALAVANPYPVRYLARPLFDHMVLKAIALRVPAERIMGLTDRLRVQGGWRRSTGGAASLPALLAP